MYKKNNGRTLYKSSRRPTYKKAGSFQNFKARNKGNISQQYNKYLKLAKEAFRSGDRIQSEYYYQFMDHYYRLMIEMGINVEENVQNNEINSTDQDGLSNENSTNESNDENKVDDQSIDTIPFIAEDTKAKKTKVSK